MSPVLKNSLAVIAGLVVGGAVNMALVVIGPILVPPPPGVDMTDMESLAGAMDQMGPQHFVFPFLAHALGTLAGATLTYVLAGRNRQMLTYGVGVFFLLGGITAARMIPAPAWFIALDLLLAYIPMAWLATRLGDRVGNRIKTSA